MTNSERLTLALCALSESERAILVEFWSSQRAGRKIDACMLIDLARPRTHTAVSVAFKKFRELGILAVDRERKAFWPRHHAPTDFGLQLIAMILGTQGEA